ncbi:TadE family protein [Bosea sp. LC85]|uniref:TadE/TadG family type IV pilus assembly protein n=1 Tax=Bosea sp. LC85 TaxID=1502851 RepID=UPI0004E28FF0|nr:TadE/TadG family type IV pilus assembly protein [Bosea sp. LC85]KFC75483.1 TadE family protein [Bosea sp. LC85]
MLQVWTRFSRSPDATSAIEFALVAPVLLLLLFGIIGYGYVLGVYHGVQQIAAEAARASVSGLNDTERERIARDFVIANVESYAFLDPAKISVSTTASGAPTPTFQVAIRYDFSDSIFHRLGSMIALPDPVVERRAVVQRGGY